jgi:hypothetical protein
VEAAESARPPDSIFGAVACAIRCPTWEITHKGFNYIYIYIYILMNICMNKYMHTNICLKNSSSQGQNLVLAVL